MKKPYVLLISFLFFLFSILTMVSPAAAELRHTVKRGESLYGIAKKFRLSVEKLQEANGLNDTNIQAGQHLIIPEQDRPGASGRKLKSPQASEEELSELDIPETHTVKKGETLAKIAYRYHLWVEDLEEINQLKGKKVKPGQIIYLQRSGEGQEEIGGGRAEKEEKKIEGRTEVSKVVLNGNGFLVEEKDRQLLARVAKGFLGLKYSRGGTSINGLDCSAYVQKVFNIFGIDLPRTAREQFQVGYTVAREALRIGDLVFFKRGQARHPGHVGIYVGDGQFIHTSLRKQRVEVNSLGNRYFSTRFIGAKRIEEVKKQPEKD
ncbi:MAG: LysM peptidoglycan-binding domain-containing protein [Thermodesulfobacteriota bacterium]|nr:LysM peptidoglycan-binding domain-containing protein [Thermodesulfobacteriota bacterium]